MRCSMLQCVAVCCSLLQFVAVCCSVLPCVAVCCRVNQCVAVCHGSEDAQYVQFPKMLDLVMSRFIVLQCGEVYCSVLQPRHTAVH